MSKNLFDLFEQHVNETPEKTAIIHDNKHLTYQELYRDANTLSAHLHRKGVTKNTHIAIIANNSIEFVTIMLSCAYLGATIVPLPLTLKNERLVKALHRSDCDFAIGWHTTINYLAENNIFHNDKLIAMGKKAGNCDFYDDFFHNHAAFSIRYNVPADTNYILTMTSGSTGDPKPIIFTQKTKINRSIIATKEIYDLNDKDTILVSTPLYHSLAQRSVLLPLLIGGTAILLTKFTAKNWLDAVEKHNVTFLFAVSTQLEAITRYIQENTNNLNLNSLNTIISSSALLKINIKENLLNTFHCNIYECYGTSEVGVVTHLKVKEMMGSVGKPLPFVDLKIEKGEILCKTLTAFEGYYNNEEATQKAHDEEGYFRTGDLGTLDANGYLFYQGRTKDVIITGAINVYPKDIEDIINEFKEVEDCAVIGIENAHFGEIIVACMTEKDNCSIKISDIQKACLKNLTDYQMPQKFKIVKSLPKSGMGKILKNDLKKRIMNEVGF
jgi:long-chain acyl-CoA synthetase